MLSQFIKMFFSQPQPKSNKLTLRLENFLVEYETTTMSSSDISVDVDEHACAKIKEYIDYSVRSPERNPKISMRLILSGHWNGKDINMEFSDLDTVQKYFLENNIISQSVKEHKMKAYN